MIRTGGLTITTPTDRDVVMTRAFEAPRRMVFDAFTTPALLVRWFGVFNGWSLDVCEIDLHVGGTCRYVWSRRGTRMGMTSILHEVIRPERLVFTEIFDDPWHDGDAVSTVVFTDQGETTTVIWTVRYDSRAIRDEVLAGPMTEGVIASFDTLATLVADQAGR